MNYSLYYKSILGYLMFGLLGSIAITIVSSRTTYSHLTEEKVEMLYNEASPIVSSYNTVYQDKPIDAVSVYPQLETVTTFIQTEIQVVECKGIIVVDNNHSGKVGTTTRGFGPTPIGSKSYCAGSYYDCLLGEVLSMSMPITGNYNAYGYVIIHLPFSQITAIQNGVLNILYIPVGTIFALSLIILLVFTQTVYIPLKRITAAANQYAEENLKHKAELHTHDEMGYLTAILNYMLDGLGQMEEYQHTFIVNVPHDLRLPLTSVRGYLEAILGDTIPPEVYGKYLTRVITGTERLSKLTRGMPTLNPLNNKGYLSRTNLDINRVIRDTAASFGGTCKDKNITSDLTSSDNIQIVYANMGKIQQTPYNLIDNVIKFNHHDSTIYIWTSIKNEKVFMSVKDAGIGIPELNQKKVWGRLYESDLSRGKDKGETGLDLVIVKEIIQSHGENTDCISTEGIDAEFIFSLLRSTSL